MNISSNESIQLVFERWQAEDRDLKTCIDGIRQWMREIEKFGIPHFGEAATRMRAMQQRLIQHFGSEDEMILELALIQPIAGAKLDELSQESTSDHSELLDRLAQLMERLNQLEPPYDSWQDALAEFEQIVVAIEDHEAEESRQVAALIPSDVNSVEFLD